MSKTIEKLDEDILGEIAKDHAEPSRIREDGTGNFGGSGGMGPGGGAGGVPGGAGGYVPIKWMVEKASDTSFTILNRTSGDVICEDIVSQVIAQKIVTMLNDGIKVNEPPFMKLMELNHAFENRVREYEVSRNRQTIQEANQILNNIRKI